RQAEPLGLALRGRRQGDGVREGLGCPLPLAHRLATLAEEGPTPPPEVGGQARLVDRGQAPPRALRRVDGEQRRGGVVGGDRVRLRHVPQAALDVAYRAAAVGRELPE